MKYNKIIHIDMDAFYASVEQRDNPELMGQPVVVGGSPNSRGVVSACSYEARKYGIHSALASSRAYKLCPYAVFIRPRFDVYKEVSEQIRGIFFEYTDLVEPLSLDEAYLDVTENKIDNPSATIIANEIRKRIYKETGLTASAGVSFNKFLAKVASDYNKPNGITVVTPEQADEFIDRLPIGKFYGIGKVTEKKMLEMGITTGADIKELSREKLKMLFGKVGEYYYKIANGEDDRPVSPHRIRKSIGKETTLGEDITDKDVMVGILREIADQVVEILQKKDIRGRTITLKLKYFDFSSVTRSVSLDNFINEVDIIMENVIELLDNTDAGIKKVRLLGISLSNLDIDEDSCIDERQLNFSF